MNLPIIRGMVRRHRRERISELINKVELWEYEGRLLIAQLVELTDPDDDLGIECRRVLDLLVG